MNCLYCHFSANKSPDPGTARGRHVHGLPHIVGPQRPASDGQPARTSAEIQKLVRYAPMATVDQNAKPIPWVRIHKVPEYVHFPHMRHVNAGVTCQTCHGQVQNMEHVYQSSSLNMGWCVSCHVNGYKPAEGLGAVRPRGYDASTRRRSTAPPDRKKARYDCANCHY